MKPGRTGVETERVSGSLPPARRVWFAGLLAIVMLVLAGAGYRIAAARVGDPEPIALPLPLDSIPYELDGWTGTDLEIQNVTQEYMKANFADDYVSRRYVSSDGRLWGNVYVVYCSSRPAGLVGHKPSICFVRSGWISDGVSQLEFESTSGRQIECLMHKFYRPMPDYRSVVVLSFYVLNGTITRDETDFANFWGRRPNLSGDPARYVAQVQVSSYTQEMAMAVIQGLADAVLAYLPDEEGVVQAMADADADGPAQTEGTGQSQ